MENRVAQAANTRKIGSDTISAMGLGCMGMSEFYGTANDAESLQTLECAVDIGVNVFDTSDFYGDGHNEILLSGLIRNKGRDKVFISTKCGIVRHQELMPNGNFKRSINNSPAYIRAACERSLQRLGVDTIDLFYLHRIDPATPMEDSVGTLADLVREGKIRYIGLSEPNAEQLTRAQQIHQIDAVQSEYSLWTRDLETTILPLCRKYGTTFFAYSPLGRGLVNKDLNLEQNDFRRLFPRFAEENRQKNQALSEKLTEFAKAYEVSENRIALSWLMSRGDDIIPIPGTRRQAHLKDNFASVDLQLTSADQEELSRIFDPANIHGAKYF